MPQNLGEELESIIHRAFDNYKVKVFNGGDSLTEKPFGEAITAISQDVREVRNDLMQNSKQTKENSELLSGMKNRKELKIYILSAFKKMDAAFNIRKIWKFVIGFFAALGGALGIYHAIQFFIQL